MRRLTNVATCGGSGIYGDDDPALETECECGRSVCELYLRFGVRGHRVGVEIEECQWLSEKRDQLVIDCSRGRSGRTSGTRGTVMPLMPPLRERFPNPPMLPHDAASGWWSSSWSSWVGGDRRLATSVSIVARCATECPNTEDEGICGVKVEGVVNRGWGLACVLRLRNTRRPSRKQTAFFPCCLHHRFVRPRRPD